MDLLGPSLSEPQAPAHFKKEFRTLPFQRGCCPNLDCVVPAVDDPSKAAQSLTWQASLRQRYTDLRSFLERLGLAEADFSPGRPKASDEFPLLVPESFVARMTPGDPHDPLLRQVLPTELEGAAPPGYSPDPLNEQALIARSPLIRKYEGRALLLATPRCALHCRFCFRRYRGFSEVLGDLSREEEILRAIRHDGTIRELILSGGDPLILEDEILERFLTQVAKIPSVRRIRIHTRIPVVLPNRITPRLIGLFQSLGRPVIVVIHVNHPQEIGSAVASSITALVHGGIPVLSQTVLLRSINDRCEVLGELFEMLVDLKVLPYYLHQLDPVRGAAHFEVPVKKGQALVAGIRTKLPGYAIPRYVREVPRLSAKEILA